jgi:hypothetical protein
VLWLTGLSRAGRSTIANFVEAELHRRGYHTYMLDGDNVRRADSTPIVASPRPIAYKTSVVRVSWRTSWLQGNDERCVADVDRCGLGLPAREQIVSRLTGI